MVSVQTQDAEESLFRFHHDDVNRAVGRGTDNGKARVYPARSIQIILRGRVR